MKLSYVEDPEGVIARAESRRKQSQGIFEISEPNELLFCQVAKEVFTQVVPGLVVDYRPPLFNVSWSDGSEQLLIKKELDFFRRINDKHELIAMKRKQQREEKILKAAASQGPLGVKNNTNDNTTQQMIPLVPEDEKGDRSLLEWRLLEVAAAHTAQRNQQVSVPANRDNSSQVQQGGTQAAKRGVIRVRNCPHLAKGNEPAPHLWLDGRASVAEIYLVNCQMSPAPPAGLRALSSLEVLDLSKNMLKTTEPSPLPPSTPQWAKDGNLRLLQKLVLRSNLLGLESDVAGILNSDSLLWCCKQLKYLDLSANPHLIALPGSISTMTKLETLKAEHCALDRVAAGVWSCTALTELNLSNNNLSYLDDLDNYAIRVPPTKLEKMKALETFDLSHNSIVSLPEDVWSLPCLSNFKIGGNVNIQTPPSELVASTGHKDGHTSRSKKSQQRMNESR